MVDSEEQSASCRSILDRIANGLLIFSIVVIAGAVSCMIVFYLLLRHYGLD